MKKLVLILIFALFLASLFSLRATKSFFTDTEKATSNILSVATEFSSTPSPTTSPSPTPTPITNHLVINEVYYDVASGKGIETDNEWVEIYNPTDGAIDISGWKICDNTYCDTIPSSAPIPANGFAVITARSTTWGFWLSIPSEVVKIILDNDIGNGLHNDNDRVILKRADDTEVDVMSYGDDTYAFSPACPDVTEGHSWERSPAGKDTDTAGDFVDRSIPTPGN